MKSCRVKLLFIVIEILFKPCKLWFDQAIASKMHIKGCMQIYHKIILYVQRKLVHSSPSTMKENEVSGDGTLWCLKHNYKECSN